MGIYGSTFIRSNEINNSTTVVTMENLFDFIEETNLEINSIFERANMIEIIKESDNELAIPRNVMDEYGFEPEKVKKTLIEKAKEIWKKFVDFVKTTFDKVTKKIQDLYMNANFTDKFISQWKDKVTWENLTKARTAGWKGLATTTACIRDLASIDDSRMFEWETLMDTGSMLSGDKVETKYRKMVLDQKEIDKFADDIIKAEDYEKAKDVYKKAIEKISEFRGITDTDYSMIGRAARGSEYFSNTPGKLYFATTTAGVDDKHYYPNMEMFKATKAMAESGQSRNKNYKAGIKTVINSVKLQADVELSNLKTYKSGGSNKTDDTEFNKIMILYYKLKYQYNVAIIQTSSRMLGVTMRILSQQHSIAIKAYLEMLMGIKKHALA